MHTLLAAVLVLVAVAVAAAMLQQAAADATHPPTTRVILPPATATELEVESAGAMPLCAEADPFVWQLVESRFGILPALLRISHSHSAVQSTRATTSPWAPTTGNANATAGGGPDQYRAAALAQSRALVVAPVGGGATGRMLKAAGFGQVDVVGSEQVTDAAFHTINYATLFEEGETEASAAQCYHMIVDRAELLSRAWPEQLANPASLVARPQSHKSHKSRFGKLLLKSEDGGNNKQTQQQGRRRRRLRPLSSYGQDVQRLLCPDGILVLPVWQCAGEQPQEARRWSVMDSVDPRVLVDELAASGPQLAPMELVVSKTMASPVLPDLHALLLIARKQATRTARIGADATLGFDAEALLPPLQARLDAVPTEAVQALQRNGWVRLPGLLSEQEAAAYAPVVDAAMADAQFDARASNLLQFADLDVRKRKGFTRVHNLYQKYPSVAALVASPRLAQAAAQLLGVDRVRVYQDSGFYKEPGDGDSTWHQDGIACPLHTDKMVGIWVALESVTPDMGPLLFATGSHNSAAPASSYSDPLEGVKETLSLQHVSMPWRTRGHMSLGVMSDEQVEAVYPVERPLTLMRAGDATAHLGWTLHRAWRNEGNRTRKAMVVQFVPADAVVHPDILSDRIPKAEVADNAQLSTRGVPLVSPDGQHAVLVHVSGDDEATWMQWVHKGWLQPGQPLPAGATPEYKA